MPGADRDAAEPEEVRPGLKTFEVTLAYVDNYRRCCVKLLAESVEQACKLALKMLADEEELSYEDFVDAGWDAGETFIAWAQGEGERECEPPEGRGFTEVEVNFPHAIGVRPVPLQEEPVPAFRTPHLESYEHKVWSTAEGLLVLNKHTGSYLLYPWEGLLSYAKHYDPKRSKA